MEMQKIPEESPSEAKEKRAEEQVAEDKGEGAEGLETYSNLLVPSEDVYAEAFGGSTKRNKDEEKEKTDEHLTSKISVELEEDKGHQLERNVRLYRVLCVVLSVICFVLLVVVVALSVKSCQKSGGTAKCSERQCMDNFNTLSSQLCTEGWITDGRFCFYKSTSRKTWAESKEQCISMGGTLAVITGQDAQNFLSASVDQTTAYWIGLKKEGSGWTWVNNEKLQTRFWEKRFTGEDPPDKDCAYLRVNKTPDGNWYKSSCQSSTYFICQRHLQPSCAPKNAEVP